MSEFMRGAVPSETVYESKEYNNFSLHEFNRDIKKSKVESLKTSYSVYGQQVPLLVNEDGIIFDGNHRFEACKELNIPFKFIVTKEVDDDLIRNLNNTQHNWTIQDFIVSNAKKGNENYQKVLELSEEFSIRAAVLARTLGTKGKGTIDIKKGELILGDIKLLRKFLRFHEKFAFMKRQKDAYFIQALFDVWSSEKADEERIYQQIVKNMELFEFSIPYKDAVQRMKDVYNQNLKKDSNKL